MVIRLVVFVMLAEIAAGQICVSSDDFDNYCSSQYAGAAVSGRCFFLARNSSDKSMIRTGQWTNGFDVCQGQGEDAVFAQIYSESEMSAIWAKFKLNMVGSNPYVLIALRNLVKVASKPTTTPAIDDRLTRWYDGASTYNGKVTANNTFLRYRANDDIEPGNDACFALYPYNNEIRFCDIRCTFATWPLPALCMITNSKQDFILTNGCFGETAIVSAPATTVNECTTACASVNWCRTFNYHDQAQTCDLFALHADDAAGSVKSGVADCYMYTADA